MSELQLIETVLKRAERRRRLEHAWRGFWQGLLIGGSVWLLVFATYKLFPIPRWSLLAAAGVAGALMLAATIIRAWRKSSLLDTARWVDSQKHLQERLSTALEVAASSSTGTWKNLVVSDAARHAKDLDPRQLLPFRLPAISRWALLVALLGVGLGFVPEYRSKQFVQKQLDVANIRDTGKHLAEFTKRSLEQRPPVLEPVQKALESVTELGEKLSKANLTRSEALRDLTSVTEKLNQETKELGQNPALKALERAAREKESGSSGNETSAGLQKQMDALQKSLGDAAGKPDALDKLKKDLQKAQQAAANMPDKNSAAGKAAREQLSQALSELAKQAQDMGQPLENLEEAIKALENNQTDLAVRDLQSALTDLDKLRDMAKALQQLQQQSAKLGKDLAEQLKQGQAQAAQQTLQKMIDQLKKSDLSPEQMQKIMSEVSKAVDPASQYGKVGERLQNAAKQMQKANQPGAAPSQQAQAQSEAAKELAEAAKELEKLQQQMADSQSLQEAMETLERAQMALSTGKNWSECQGGQCSACNGAGCSQCNGKGSGKGGKPSGGVGTWSEETGWSYAPEKMQPVDNSGVTRPDMDARGHADRGDAELNKGLMPTKVRGQMSQGGPMPSITLKGVNIKGQSTVQYQEAATAAQTEAQSALNQDQVPRAYRGQVRDYFDDLKK